MRLAAAILVAGVAIAGAAYLASLHLGRAYLNLQRYPFFFHERAAWQIPVAIIIAAIGLQAAIVVARPRSGDDRASNDSA